MESLSTTCADGRSRETDIKVGNALPERAAFAKEQPAQHHKADTEALACHSVASTQPRRHMFQSCVKRLKCEKPLLQRPWLRETVKTMPAMQ